MGLKLTWEQVREIRDAYASNNTSYVMQELAEKYGVSYHSIWEIVRGVKWKDPEYKPVYNYNYRGENVHRARLTLEQVREIRRSCKPGDLEFGVSALARKYGLSRTVISDIVNGKTYKED